MHALEDYNQTLPTPYASSVMAISFAPSQPGSGFGTVTSITLRDENRH
jgi:hypothetical protein